MALHFLGHKNSSKVGCRIFPRRMLICTSKWQDCVSFLCLPLTAAFSSSSFIIHKQSQWQYQLPVYSNSPLESAIGDYGNNNKSKNGHSLVCIRNAFVATRRRTMTSMNQGYDTTNSNDKLPNNVDKDDSDDKRQYFLLKSEPDEFSIDDLYRCHQSEWDGVRSYAARNILQRMRVGDRAWFYHSSCSVPAIVGEMIIIRTAQPDRTALDPNHKYYDAALCTKMELANQTPSQLNETKMEPIENPHKDDKTESSILPKKKKKAEAIINPWVSVLVQWHCTYETPVTLSDIKAAAALKAAATLESTSNQWWSDLVLLQRGSRLSVQPVTMAQWTAIQRLRQDNKATLDSTKSESSKNDILVGDNKKRTNSTTRQARDKPYGASPQVTKKMTTTSEGSNKRSSTPINKKRPASLAADGGEKDDIDGNNNNDKTSNGERINLFLERRRQRRLRQGRRATD